MIVVITLLVWCVAAVLLGLIIGRILADADRREQAQREAMQRHPSSRLVLAQADVDREIQRLEAYL